MFRASGNSRDVYLLAFFYRTRIAPFFATPAQTKLPPCVKPDRDRPAARTVEKTFRKVTQRGASFTAAGTGTLLAGAGEGVTTSRSSARASHFR